MKWKIPEYSKTQINNAGKVIKDDNSNYDDIEQARKIIDNWRASHAFPLQVIYCHFKRNNNPYIVAQRLKRLDSIIKKLKREPVMNLWRMQDLGGCRVVVPTLEEVYSVATKYKKSRVRHILIKTKDYIKEPKKSGYRSLHMVYKYQSDTKDTFNRNMIIEIQIRTQLQHIWATSLETVGLFTNQALKSSNGECDTLRFFALVSSLFAIEEGQPLIPDTPEEIADILTEIKELDKKNHYLKMLSGISVAIDHLEEKNRNQKGYYILIFNYKTRRLRLKFYKTQDIIKATDEYNKIEKTRAENEIDAVLVSVSSFNTLKAAYPNYFTDISEFRNKVISYIGSD